jgi:hypothetical protein
MDIWAGDIAIDVQSRGRSVETVTVIEMQAGQLVHCKPRGDLLALSERDFRSDNRPSCRQLIVCPRSNETEDHE